MSALHALLVGVDGYRPSRGPDGLRISDLAGACGDALQVERYLLDGPLAVPADRIRTLISPSPLSGLKPPLPEDLPTRANLVRALRDLTTEAEAGDQVLIHFSGHGVRVASAAAVKGPHGLDEALVPCDAGSPDGGVLRDVELYRLLSDLSATGAYVTLVLDACHAGGAVRGQTRSEGQVRVRGLGERNGQWGPAESPLGNWSDLYGRLGEAKGVGQRPGYRHVAARSGWFPQPERCVLLAACRGPELARELPMGKEGVVGAFTHSLLERLASRGEDVSYGELLDAVQERIYSRWSTQTPVVEGEAELRFLGAGQRPASPAAEAQGGETVPVPCSVAAAPGTDSALLEPLLEATPAGIDLACGGSVSADFLLGVRGGRALEVCDPFGAPIPESGPPIPVDAPDAGPELGRRLEHLARYERLRNLAAPADSCVRDVLRLGLFRVEREEDCHDPAARRPAGTDPVRDGQLLCLLVRNTSEQALNLVVLDLRPDWAVERVHPGKDEADFGVIEAGRDYPVFLKAFLPGGRDRAHDRLLVLASVAPIRSRSLRLPVLAPMAGSSARRQALPQFRWPEGRDWTAAAMDLVVVP